MQFGKDKNNKSVSKRQKYFYKFALKVQKESILLYFP